MSTCLNWRELGLLIQKIRPEIEGLFVERIIVPARENFPAGYLKGEWAIRLTGRSQQGVLIFSIRARHPYITWRSNKNFIKTSNQSANVSSSVSSDMSSSQNPSPGASQGTLLREKGPRAAPLGTRSPFDLEAQKHLKGAKLLECVSIPKERIAILWFSAEGNPDHRLGLVLVLIPAAPEALLILNELTPKHHVEPAQSEPGYLILGRSRTIRDESKIQTRYIPPDGAKAPENLEIRADLVLNPDRFFEKIEEELCVEAFSLRVQIAEKALKSQMKQAQDRLKQSEVALREAQREQDWQKWGDLLKGALGQNVKRSAQYPGQIEVYDYLSEQQVLVPLDSKLTIKDQVEKYYQNARRKIKRIHEAQSRISRFKEVLSRLETLLSQKPQYSAQSSNWKALEQWETSILGSRVSKETQGKTGASSSMKWIGGWIGKSFVSKDGLPILVGRDKDENLELTFKHARGNDVWMHVRGRPGAHIVIPVQPGKSVPLETLLDAANLAVHYSGGANWGKTEVDYTLKKYVKRIKNSNEASYTHNKTLLVEPDAKRRERLLGQT